MSMASDTDASHTLSQNLKIPVQEATVSDRNHEADNNAWPSISHKVAEFDNSVTRTVSE